MGDSVVDSRLPTEADGDVSSAARRFARLPPVVLRRRPDDDDDAPRSNPRPEARRLWSPPLERC